MEDFTKGLILGKGSYGVVYSGLSKSNGKKVVLKEIILTGLSDNEVEKTFKEAQILSKLKHPHVIKYYNHSIEKHVLTIFMEYAANGTLKDFLENRVEFLEETLVIKFFSQLLLAVEYVHDLNIIHKDICNKNVLISYNNMLKLSDFGISRHLESCSSNGLAGHPGNLAPELCHGGHHSKASDMWALGCILYELTSLKSPFSAPTIAGLMLCILESSTPKLPTKYNKWLQTLVKCLLCRDPTSRPSAKALLSHPLLATYIHTLPVVFVEKSEIFSEMDKELLTYFCPNIFDK